MTSDKTIPKRSAATNPLISNPGTIMAVRRTMRAVITKLKRPRVTRLIGNVKSKTIGRITVLTNPKTTATTIATKKFSIWTPGIRYALMRTAIPLTIRFSKIVIIQA